MHTKFLDCLSVNLTGIDNSLMQYYLAGRCGGKSQINTDYLWGLVLDNWKYSKLMKSKSKQSRYVRVYL